MSDAMERWDGWLERTLTVLVGAALAFAILAFGAVRIREFLVVEALTGLALLVWLARIWLVRDHRLLWPPVCWGVLAFAGWAAWRALEADIAYVAWSEVMRVLTYTALFFITLNNLHRQNTSQAIAWTVVTVATLACFLAGWQYATGDNTVWGLYRSDMYVGRGSGTYANPNHFAGLLELLLPLAVVTVIAGRMKALGRVLLGYAALVMLAGLALTFSRGGWIAAAAGLGFVLLTLVRNRDYRWPALICIGVFAIGFAVALTRTDLMQQRLENSHDLDPQARNSRPQIWRAAIAMWRDHPWFGVGPAHFNERFKQYRSDRVHGEPERAHNDYIDALADWGIAGTALIVVPWALLGYGIVRTLRQVRRGPGDLEAKRSGRYSFVLGATGGLAALLVHAAFDFNFHIPANAMVAVTWMGLLAGYSRYATDDWWVSSKRPWRVLVSLVVIAPLTTAIAWDLSRRAPETVHIDQARKAPFLSDAQLASLKAAWAAEPRNASAAAMIGELLRRRSFEGLPGHEELAREAIEWFGRASQLHPYHPMYPLSIGITLDWLGEADTWTHFEKALSLDPNGRITSYYLGWHHEQKGDFAAAREWYEKSLAQGWPPYQPSIDALNRLKRQGR